MTTISANLQAVHRRIGAAAESAGRAASEIRLLAVSKTVSAERIREAVAAGQHAFGENYLQEGLAKIEALADLDLDWHFIGPLQANKTRTVANRFAWVHGVDRLKIAERLSAAREAADPPLQICLQVNVSGEASKHGVAPDEVFPLAHAVANLPRLRLRGLMAIPEPSEDPDLLRNRFDQLRQLKDELDRAGLALDTLSMGMSHDLETAIQAGATLVRIGTAIFGERQYT